MGNSNSIPNLASTNKQRFTLEELHSYYQQEGLNFNSDNRRSLHKKNDNQPFQSRLTDAYLHETYQQQLSSSLPPIAHVKVLPDFNPDGARLRCTTNGNILNSGGTISGRKENQQQSDLSIQSSSFVPSSSSLLPSQNVRKRLSEPSAQIIRNRSIESPGPIIRNRSTESPGPIIRNRSTESPGPIIRNRSIESPGQIIRNRSIESPGQIIRNRSTESPGQIIRNRSTESPGQITRNRSIESPGPNIRNRSSDPLPQLYRNKSCDQIYLKDLNLRNYALQSPQKTQPINQNKNEQQQNENTLNQRNDDINRNQSYKLNLFSLSGKTANIVKCKKKQSAPLAPPTRTSTDNNIINATNTNNRNNSYDNKSFQKQLLTNQIVQQKKLRLFKTNAETKKSLPLPTTSQFQNNNNNNSSRGNTDHTSLTGQINGIGNIDNKKNMNKTGNHNYKDTRVKLFPTPIIFRREKSFDASLLLNHNKQQEYNNNNDIDLKRNQNMKQTNQQNIINDSISKNQFKQNQYDNEQQQRSANIKKSNLENKISKINNQPSQFKNNFKKELEEATKNRRNSISAIDLTLLNNTNYDNNELKPTSAAAAAAAAINNNNNDIDKKSINKNRKLSNGINQQNDDKNIKSSKKDNQNLNKSQLISRKFYFGMGSNKKKDQIKDELIKDLHEKLSNSSLSGCGDDIENRISTSKQLIDKNILNEFNKNIPLNHQRDLNSCLSSESDDILLTTTTSDLLNHRDLSPQPYKIPKNCINTNDDDDSGDIQLNVRPTLPRRQLEIPRFSPSAAWRMLNEGQKNLLKNLTNNRQLNTLNSSTETLSSTVDLIKQQPSSSPIIEERIQRIFREPPLIYSDNKSGDSGISGDDAGLQLDGGIESPGINFINQHDPSETNKVNKNGHELRQNTDVKNGIGNYLIPWTPQQDLEDEDDDDDDDEDDISSSDGNNILGNKLLNDDPDGIRGHVFSVSLPRESHHQGPTFNDKEKFGFSSLQKLKRTVSGAFLAGSNCTSNSATQIANSNNFNSLQNDMQQTSQEARTSNYCSDNWLLSRSALNSIENSQISSSNNNNIENLNQNSKIKKSLINNNDTNLINPTSPDHKTNETLIKNDVNFKGSSKNGNKIQSSSLNYVTTGRHMMYLPNRIKDKDNNNNNNNSEIINIENNRKNNKKQSNNLPIKTNYKKDNNNYKKEQLRESLQDSMPVLKEKKSAAVNRSKNSPNHRFTFQSTVRQIERRRLAERLSKEAEEKEALRKSELEAMTRVEEEFQRKRAREKATICHQLRLYSMEENQCNSLPIDMPVYNDESIDIKNDLSLQKLPINNRTNKNKYNNISRNYRAEPDGAVSNSPPASPSYSQNKHRNNNMMNCDTEYFNISDDSKGYQNSNQRQRKNSTNLDYFQKSGYIDESYIPNRSPIQRYNNDSSKLLNSEKNGKKHNIDYDATNQNEYNSDSDISGKNHIRMKYRRH